MKTGKSVQQSLSEKDLKKLTREQFHEKWFIEALTDRQIAKMYNTDTKTVRQFRKELKLNWLNSAILYLMGGDRYRKKNLWINR